MTRLNELHAQWLSDPAYKEAFDALEPEFELAQALIEARTQVGLTQEELAQRMATSQAAIVRMESGKSLPSPRLLQRFAQATGTRLRISFEQPR